VITDRDRIAYRAAKILIAERRAQGERHNLTRPPNATEAENCTKLAAAELGLQCL
jgi:hypothetical protein